MMAPQFERARMLHAAIEAATHELGEPVDRVEVTPPAVLLWAGGKTLALKYHYANSRGPDGVPILGGGQWVVEKAGWVDAPPGLLARAFSRLRRAWVRSAS